MTIRILEKDGTFKGDYAPAEAASIVGIHVSSLYRLLARRVSRFKGFICLKLTPMSEDQLKKELHQYLKKTKNHPERRKHSFLTPFQIDSLFTSFEFKKTYLIFEASKFDPRYKPTLDRINPFIGYTISNVQWLTRDENLKKAVEDRKLLKDDVKWFVSHTPTALMSLMDARSYHAHSLSIPGIKFKEKPYIDFVRESS